MHLLRSRVALLILASIPAVAASDEFHDKNLLVGDRAIGLGGGYVALSADPSGMFYNPAGIVGATELTSASINAYVRSSTRYQNFFADGGSYTDTSSSIVPSYFGILRHYYWGTIGLSVAVPDFQSESQTNAGTLNLPILIQVGPNTFNQVNGTGTTEFSTDIDSSVYDIGLSIGEPLDDVSSVGFTLYGVYHTSRASRQINDAYSGADNQGDSSTVNVVQSTRITESIYGIKPQLGYKRSFGSQWTLGAMLTKELSFDRSYRVNSTVAETIQHVLSGNSQPTGFINTPPGTQVNSSASQAYPWQLSLGATYAIDPSILTTVQADFYSKADGDRSANINNGTVQRRALINWTAGLELVCNSRLSVRYAAFSSYSNLSDLVANSGEQQTAVNLYGASAGATYKGGAHVFQAGIYYSRGEGKGNPGSLSAAESGVEFTPLLVNLTQTNLAAYFGVSL